ncbi:hypothetical protein BG011_001602 [Mortierella polycephala]|uniref:DUF202 domain-containing protein n=1 Tax=Mortierella polycephala TaxID=41804 RepID=A0A9P6Q8H6_9FUNG|nr:hypothetical protein BG011_001602 [Mortierella polycephala]
MSTQDHATSTGVYSIHSGNAKSKERLAELCYNDATRHLERDSRPTATVYETDIQNLQIASRNSKISEDIKPNHQPIFYMPDKPCPAVPATIACSSQITSVGSRVGGPYETLPETIIHFPDLNPSLTHFSFTPSPPASSTDVAAYHDVSISDTQETPADLVDDDTEKRQSISKRMSWMSIGFGSLEKRLHPTAQQNLLPTNNLGLERALSRKDSNMTLTSVINAGRREDLKEMTDDHSINKRFYRTQGTDSGLLRRYSDASGTASTLKLNMGTTHRAHTKAIGGIGGGDDPRKQPNRLLVHAVPQASVTESAFSMTGKRYVDTRKRNKGRKSAFKTSEILFSNERTFIHWIKFGMLLGALAMTLLNFSDVENVNKGINHDLANRVGRIGQLVGMSLMAICLLCLIYASATYHWRHIGVAQNKSDNRYFDRIGPTVLTMGLFIAYSINVFLTIQLTSKMDSNYQPSIFYNVHGESSAPASPSIPMASPPIPTASPPIPTASPPPQPFDMPPLPSGSTILVDEDDNSGHSGPESEEEPPVVATEEDPSSDDANGGEESESSVSEEDLES